MRSIVSKGGLPMKKLLAAVAAGMLLTGAVCFAAVPADEVAIAGVAPGSSVENAKSKLGEPTHTTGKKLYFSNGIMVEVAKYNPGMVEEIEILSAGAATPGGVQVGMAESAITEKYGQPDKLDRDYDDTEYTYYSHDYVRKMEFKVVGGKIVKIKCEMR